MAVTGDTPPHNAPALKLTFLSHDTLKSRDLALSCRFYEEFLASRSFRQARFRFSLDWTVPTPCRRLQQQRRRNEPPQPRRARCPHPGSRRGRQLSNGSIIPLRALALSHSRLLLRSTTYLGIDARALEIAVQMTFAVLVALFEQPAIAAFRIGQDLPAIIVAIPKEETVGAVLEMRLGDFLEMPLLSLGADDAVCLIYLLLGADIQPVVVEEVHPADVLTVNDGNGVGATQSNEKRDRARLNDLETQKLLIEAARENKVAALQRAVRKEVELERGHRFTAPYRCNRLSN